MDSQTTPPVASPLRRRQILAVAAGNALEFYDFLTYAFFAVQIGRTFFPSSSAHGSLLAALATFGAGFLTRPLGAWVIGRMGDRSGRKPAMMLSFSLIGVAVTGLALTPSYASIGIAAPILAICFRMLQGFAVGGEVGPSSAFLIEAAPRLRRGLYTAIQPMTADLSVLVAGLVGLLLANLLSDAALTAWGWRLALLLGVAIVPLGLVLRGSLEETLQREDDIAPQAGKHQAGKHPADAVPVSLAPIALLGIALLASATISNYTLTYLTTYAVTTLAMPTRLAFGATILVGLAGVICDPLGGWLSDRFGRKPVLIVPACLLLVLVVPCFHLLAALRTPAALYATALVLGCCSTLSTVSTLVVIVEALPKSVRSGGLSLIYAVSIAVFGGSAQFVIAWLIDATGNPVAPAYYLAASLLVGLVAMACLRETAPARIDARRA